MSNNESQQKAPWSWTTKKNVNEYDALFIEGDRNKIFKVLEYLIYNNVKFSARDIKNLDEKILYDYLIKFNFSNESHYYKNRDNASLTSNIHKLIKLANISDNFIYKLREIPKHKNYNFVSKLSKTDYNISKNIDKNFYDLYVNGTEDEVKKIISLKNDNIDTSKSRYDMNIALNHNLSIDFIKDYIFDNKLDKSSLEIFVSQVITSRSNADEIIQLITFITNLNLLSKKEISSALKAVEVNENTNKFNYAKLGSYLSNYAFCELNCFIDKDIGKIIRNFNSNEISRVILYLVKNDFIYENSLVEICQLLSSKNDRGAIMDIFCEYPNKDLLKDINVIDLGLYHLKIQESLNIKNSNAIFEIFNEFNIYEHQYLNNILVLFLNNPFLSDQNIIKLNEMLEKSNALTPDSRIAKKYENSLSINSEEKFQIIDINTDDEIDKIFLKYDEEFYRNNLTYSLFVDNCQDKKIIKSFFDSNDSPNMLKYNPNLTEEQFVVLAANEDNLISILNNEGININVVKFIIEKHGFDKFEDIQKNICNFNENLFNRNSAYNLLSSKNILETNSITLKEFEILKEYVDINDLMKIINNNKDNEELIDYIVTYVNIDYCDSRLSITVQDNLSFALEKRKIINSMNGLEF